MAGHITACIDGDSLDTWDCSYRSVYTAWEDNKIIIKGAQAPFLLNKGDNASHNK